MTSARNPPKKPKVFFSVLAIFVAALAFSIASSVGYADVKQPPSKGAGAKVSKKTSKKSAQKTAADSSSEKEVESDAAQEQPSSDSNSDEDKAAVQEATKPIHIPEHLTKADAQRIYREATEACLHGRTNEGLEAYKKLLTAGFTGADINYNIGTALLRDGKLGPAILHLERAAVFSPDDQDIASNLALAQKLRIDMVKDAPESAVGEAGGSLTRQVANSTNADHWTIAFLSLWLLGWIFILLVRKFSARQGLMAVIGTSLVLLSLPPGAIVASHIWSSGHGSEAIVMSKALPVREGPDQALSPTFEIHEGLKVLVTDQEKGFRAIRLENGLQGWVPAGGIAKIKSRTPGY